MLEASALAAVPTSRSAQVSARKSVLTDFPFRKTPLNIFFIMLWDERDWCSWRMVVVENLAAPGIWRPA